VLSSYGPIRLSVLMSMLTSAMNASPHGRIQQTSDPCAQFHRIEYLMDPIYCGRAVAIPDEAGCAEDLNEGGVESGT
jgi:hypothetical protein